MVKKSQAASEFHSARINSFQVVFSGLSGLGLRVLKSSKEKVKYLNAVKRHLRPEPRIEFVRDFVIGIKQIGGVIDISDGLIIDLYRILKASGKGAELYESGIPIHPELGKYFKSKTKIFDLVFYGGEDFELIFTINKKFKEKVLKIAKRVKVPISLIGRITKSKAPDIILKSKTTDLKLKIKGFDHLK